MSGFSPNHQRRATMLRTLRWVQEGLDGVGGVVTSTFKRHDGRWTVMVSRLAHQRAVQWICLWYVSLFTVLSGLGPAPSSESSSVLSESVATPAGLNTAERVRILFDDIPDLSQLEDAARSGAVRCFVVGQSIDPQAGKTGLIDAEVLVEGIRRETKGTLPDWGLLDFEDPFHEALQEGPESERCKKTQRSMIAAIVAVRRSFPDTKWGYYGCPWLPYWLQSDGKWFDWITCPEPAKRAAIARGVEIYAPIAQASDWLCPTIYPKYDPALMHGQDSATIRAQGRAWRAAEVGLAMLIRGSAPVIPIVCPWWTPGGKARFCTVVAQDQFGEDQIRPALAMGARGIVIWSAATYQIGRMTDRDQAKYHAETNFGTSDWRRAVVEDYLEGREPEDWTDPKVREKLVIEMSRTITRAIQDCLRIDADLKRTVSGDK